MKRPPIFNPLDKGIQYGVNIPGYHTAKSARNDVMSKDTWLEGVKGGMFIDDDGYGNGIKADGTVVQRVRPSMADELGPDVEFVVWFNK